MVPLGNERKKTKEREKEKKEEEEYLSSLMWNDFQDMLIHKKGKAQSRIYVTFVKKKVGVGGKDGFSTNILFL